MISKPAEIWTSEQLERAAISELLSHGGNEQDVALLRQQFKANNQPRVTEMEIADDGTAS